MLNNFHYQTEWPRLDEGGLDKLKEWLDAHPKTRLIVIDTLQRVKPPGRGSNQYEDDYRALGKLQKMAVSKGVAVVLIHHLRKAASEDPFDQMSGSTGLTGAADTMILLRRGRGEQEAEMLITGRDIEEKHLALSFDSRFGTWTIQGDAIEQGLQDSARAVFEVLRQSPTSLTPKEIWQHLGGEDSRVSSAVVRQKLPILLSKGLIEKAGTHYKSLENTATAATTATKSGPEGEIVAPVAAVAPYCEEQEDLLMEF